MNQTWKEKRTKTVMGLRDDKYIVKVPDVMTLINDWLSFKVDMTQKELGKEVTKQEVVRGLLTKYMVEPAFEEEMLEDQADIVLIYKAIISQWTANPDKVADFFRQIFPANAPVDDAKSATPQTAK